MEEQRSSYRGRITGITEESWGHEKGNVRVEVELAGWKPPKAKATKQDAAMPAPAYPPTRTHYVTKALAGHLKVGDQIVCETTIRKVRALKKKERH